MTAESQTISPDQILLAAEEFDKIAAEYDEWYMARSRVSLAMMADRDEFLSRCKWAANELRERANKS